MSCIRSLLIYVGWKNWLQQEMNLGFGRDTREGKGILLDQADSYGEEHWARLKVYFEDLRYLLDRCAGR